MALEQGEPGEVQTADDRDQQEQTGDDPGNPERIESERIKSIERIPTVASHSR